LTIGDIHVFTLHTSFFCATNEWLGKKYLLDFVRYDTVFLFELVDKDLFPNHFIETHLYTCT